MEPLLMPVDYLMRESSTYQIGDVIIYIPTSSDQPGYYNFPGTTNPERAQIVELRTGRLEDGFRLKEELKGAILENSGRVLQR